MSRTNLETQVVDRRAPAEALRQPRATIAGDPIDRAEPVGAALVVVSIIVVLLRDPFPSRTTLGSAIVPASAAGAVPMSSSEDDYAPGWTRPDS